MSSRQSLKLGSILVSSRTQSKSAGNLNISMLQAESEGWVGENDDVDAELLAVSAQDVPRFESVAMQQIKKRQERSSNSKYDISHDFFECDMRRNVEFPECAENDAISSGDVSQSEMNELFIVNFQNMEHLWDPPTPPDPPAKKPRSRVPSARIAPRKKKPSQSKRKKSSCQYLNQIESTQEPAVDPDMSLLDSDSQPSEISDFSSLDLDEWNVSDIEDLQEEIAHISDRSQENAEALASNESRVIGTEESRIVDMEDSASVEGDSVLYEKNDSAAISSVKNLQNIIPVENAPSWVEIGILSIMKIKNLVESLKRYV
jgi:hypothetical protein